MTIILLSLLGATAPAAFLLHFVYVRDKYEREPLRLVLRVYFISFFTVIPAIILEALGGWFVRDAEQYALLYAAIVAFLIVGLSEEGSKLLFMRWLAFHHREFDEVYDGILYSVAVSLGFATVENILYVFSEANLETRAAIVVMRALLSVPAHTLFGVMMGYYVGRAKFATAPGERRRLLWTGLLLAVFWHGLYDFLLLALDAGLPAAYGAVAVLVAIVTVAWMWVIGSRYIGRAQRESIFRRPAPLLHPLAAFNHHLRYCPRCGAPAPNPTRFCTHCGQDWSVYTLPEVGRGVGADSGHDPDPAQRSSSS